MRNEAETRATVQQLSNDVASDGAGQSEHEANVGAVQHDLELAGRSESERVSGGNQEVRDGAVDRRERAKPSPDARQESNELEQPKGLLPRPHEGSGRSEKGTAACSPDGHLSVGPSNHPRSKWPGRDDVDVVPALREVVGAGLNEVARRICRPLGVRRREEGDAHGWTAYTIIRSILGC